MDPFDDILPAAPAARARAGGRFIPKAKSKQLPQKQVPALEDATSCKDGRNEHVASSSTSTDTEGISQNESSRHPPLEHPSMEHTTNSESGKSPKVHVNGDTAALVDPLHSTISAAEVDTDWDFMNFPKSTHKAGPVGFDVGLDANFIPETNLNNGATLPVQSANAVENVLSNVAVPSSTCSNIGRMEEPHKNGEGSFLDGNKRSELIDVSLQAGLDVGLKSASDHKVATLESNIHSNFNFGREQQVESFNFELDPFSDILPDPGARNARKFQPKIKPRPRVGTAPATASPNVVMEKTVEMPTSCTNKVQSFHSGSDHIGRPNQSTNLPLATSEILRTTDLPNKFDYLSSSIPFSEDNKSLGTVDSLNAMLSDVAESVQNGARDWPSGFSKSGGESADIFSGLESLDDFLTQAAADTGQVRKCPDYNTTQDSLTFNEATVLNEDDTHTNNRSETEEVINLNPACPVDDGIDCPAMKSGANPIPEPEELTNAADSPTLADFLHANVTGGKEDANEREKDGKISSYLRKHKISLITGHQDEVDKPSRQLRKKAASKPVNDIVNDDVEDDDDLDPPYDSNMDELEPNDYEFGVDDSSKKKRASTSSKKKSGGKNGKTSQKRERTNKDSEISDEGPPKKFSHSTRRRKRCVDKALLEIPEDELDPKTLPLKDIILLAEYRERLAKKEATTSKTSSANRRGGDSLHETDVNNEEEILGLEDGEDPGDDEASGSIPSAPTLFNYQSFMDKEPRGKWSKQDTELFYEAVRQFGTDFSMIQQLFPGRTRHQVKLKYKKEERQHPLQLYDAVNNRAEDLSHFKLVIERLQQASTKAEQDPITGASDVMTVDEVEELRPGTNEEVATTAQDANNVKDQEEVATTEQDANVKDQEDSVALSPEQSDDSDDDFQRWSQYKSDY